MKLYLYGHDKVHRDSYATVIDREQAARTRDLMFWFLRKYKKREISAPQLGVPVNMAAVMMMDGTLKALVNPKIEQMHGFELEQFESCISCPPMKENQCLVARVQFVHVMSHTVDQMGWKTNHVFKGRDARHVQHAIDHLSGTFFFDRVATAEKKKITERFDEWRKMRKITDLTVATKES